MAPAQVYSFVSQSLYFATYLLKYSLFNCYLSVEEIGDIGVEGEKNEIVELKNAQHPSHNPLSNNSIDLWKTLYNWAMFFYKNSSYNIDDFRLNLYVNTSNCCKTKLSEKINDCSSETDFKNLVLCIKKDILKNETYRRKSLKNVRNKVQKGKAGYYVECLLSSELFKIFEKVCYHFEYKLSDIDYYTQLTNLLRINYGIQDLDCLDTIAQLLIGWVDKIIVQSKKNNQPTIIYTQDFEKFTKKYIGNYFMPNKYMKHPNLKPAISDIEQEKRKSPKYLRQLEIIDLNNLKNQTASYFLQLKEERKNWIKSGLLQNVSDEKYISFQQSLYSTWELYFEIEKLSGNEEKLIGRNVLAKMLAYNENKFDDEILDDDLTRGFIHELADYKNDNRLSIGWHPNYKELLNDYEK